jgi:hypothetical protein
LSVSIPFGCCVDPAPSRHRPIPAEYFSLRSDARKHSQEATFLHLDRMILSRNERVLRFRQRPYQAARTVIRPKRSSALRQEYPQSHQEKLRGKGSSRHRHLCPLWALCVQLWDRTEGTTLTNQWVAQNQGSRGQVCCSNSLRFQVLATYTALLFKLILSRLRAC